MTQPATIRTRIWQETPAADNPFAAEACLCHGYDVYGDILTKATWSEYLYLLFRGERPTTAQAATLEALAVALANAGPRDASIHAAMCAGVGGSSAASALMAALAVGAGQLGGAREAFLMMEGWLRCGTDLAAWQRHLQAPPADSAADSWPAMEHASGFDPHGVTAPAPVLQTLRHLAAVSQGACLSWLEAVRCDLEAVTRRPLSMTGVAATALHDLGFSPSEGELAYLLLRLPGAAVHALEQRKYGYKTFPFFSIELEGQR